MKRTYTLAYKKHLRPAADISISLAKRIKRSPHTTTLVTSQSGRKARANLRIPRRFGYLPSAYGRPRNSGQLNCEAITINTQNWLCGTTRRKQHLIGQQDWLPSNNKPRINTTPQVMGTRTRNFTHFVSNKVWPAHHFQTGQQQNSNWNVNTELFNTKRTRKKISVARCICLLNRR